MRQATPADIRALTRLRGSEAVHRDRIREARAATFDYVVLELEGVLCGFACLVWRRPLSWSDAADLEHLPQIVDLYIDPARRGEGHGSFLLRELERLASQQGSEELYLAVDPVHNPRALTLYRRLGYRALQPQPCRKAWSFVDSAGELHQGDSWLIDMVKRLA